MTQWIDFDHIKKQVSMESVLERYGVLGSLRRNGDSLIGVCPLPTHAHMSGKRNPTQFNVWLTKNGWHCFGDCQDHGNVFDFVSVMEGMSRSAPGYPREPALKIMEWFGLTCERPQGSRRTRATTKASETIAEPPPTSPPVLPKAQARPEPKAETPKVNVPLKFALKSLQPDHPYLLQERGLTPEITAEFGCGFFAGKGIMAGRVAIPIHNEHGELVAYAGRWPGEPPEGEGKYRLPPGFHKSLVVFNLHRAKELAKEKGVIVVEGFFDAMKVAQAGYPNVIALMGSSMSDEQERFIVEAVGAQGKVALMLDEDEAGRSCRDGKVKDGAVEPSILQRLASRVYVKVIALGREGMQPDRLSEEEIRTLIG